MLFLVKIVPVSGDVRHRAILGQIMAVVVDEMLRGTAKVSQALKFKTAT